MFKKKSSRIILVVLLPIVFAIVSGGILYHFFGGQEPPMELARQNIPANTLTNQTAPAGTALPEGNTPPGQPAENAAGENAASSNMAGENAAGSDMAAEATGSDPGQPTVTTNTIDKGDTAGRILQPWLNASEISEVIDICSEVYPLGKLRSGQSYTVHEDENGFARFEYEVDKRQKLVICRTPDATFTAQMEEIEYDVILSPVEGVIKTNLFNAMSDQGENATLAIIMADVLAWEINFIKDLRVGDTFSLVVEKLYQNGEFKAYGRLWAVRFVNQGKTFEAFYFEDEPGQTQYFTHDGESVKRAFLKAPLSFTRISSGFSNNRLHPILGINRPHPGVDYAAPTGTPVKAIGRGKVTYAGWGTGAGRYISIEHPNGYETTYMHLSGFAKNLKKGSSVSQGEVIGYVGSTGYATGPHLDFRMKKSGAFINPLQALSPRDVPVKAKNLQSFKRQVFLYQSMMNGGLPVLPKTASTEKQPAGN